MYPFSFILDEPYYNGNDPVYINDQNFEIHDVCETESLEAESIAPTNLQTSDSNYYQDVTSFLCPICGKKFLDMKKFKDHCRRNQMTSDLGCHKCNKQFCSMRFLEQHLLTHSQDPHECAFCNKQFKHRRTLQQHIKMHSKVIKYKCDKCPKEFSSPFNLKRHVNKIHS